MNPSDYLKIKFLVSRTHADEIKYVQDLKPCQDPFVFFREYVWVVVNSGMRNQVAEGIYKKIMQAIADRKPIKSAYRHPGKAAAIKLMARNYEGEFRLYQEAENKLDDLDMLPWIGPITKYHLARNLGLDVCKPDRHLVRIAKRFKTTPEDLCSRLSKATGDRIGTVDVVLWRAANLGLI